VGGLALDRALAAAVEAARAAGKIALGYYHGGFEVTIKSDLTPVTQADRREIRLDGDLEAAVVIAERDLARRACRLDGGGQRPIEG